jgi:polyribonucleotide nucleotidyltransferase
MEYGAGVEDGATELTLRARDAESLELAQKLVGDALKKADGITHIGYMTFPDRGAFPRIIGSKGAVINDLSVETEAEIIVPRDDSTIKIYGSCSSLSYMQAILTNIQVTKPQSLEPGRRLLGLLLAVVVATTIDPSESRA